MTLAPATTAVDPLDHRGLVMLIARGYQGRGLDFEDLFAEGMIGLMTACEKFDPERGVQFSTYASYWIRQQIWCATMDTGRLIRVPKYLYQKNPARPNNPERVAAAKRIFDAVILRDGDGGDDRSLHLGDLAVDRSERHPDFDDDPRAEVERLLAHLDPREAEILRRRFGIGGGPLETLKSIGESIGIGRERVRQIEEEALNKLRIIMNVPISTRKKVRKKVKKKVEEKVKKKVRKPRRISVGKCPDCGRAFGRVRRCYTCRPGLTPEAQQRGLEAARAARWACFRREDATT